jgi:hypothetical protein
MTRYEIQTATNYELTAKVIFAFQTLTAAEKQDILKVLKVRESMLQTSNRTLNQAIAKLEKNK